jgi:GAF domain-containing protein
LTQDLQETQQDLELRVVERTHDLERRARYLEATAEVARGMASVLDLDVLLRQVVTLLCERFELQRAGVFLLDASGEWAEAAVRASFVGGKLQVIDEELRLQVGGKSIIGRVALSGEAYLTSDVREDPFYFGTAETSTTRSELALPLQSRGEVFGVLDVQSSEVGAILEQDVLVMQTLADQVAMAINNARLFRRLGEALTAERRARGELSQEAWRDLLRAQPNLGFLSDARGTLPVGDAWDAEMLAAVQSGVAARGEGDEKALAMPVKARGEVVAVIDAHLPDEAAAWTPEQVSLLETLSRQLAVALESAQLYRESQRRARREAMTREITDKMRRAASVEEIVRVAVDELAGVLGRSRTFVRMGVGEALLAERHEEQDDDA